MTINTGVFALTTSIHNNNGDKRTRKDFARQPEFKAGSLVRVAVAQRTIEVEGMAPITSDFAVITDGSGQMSGSIEVPLHGDGTPIVTAQLLAGAQILGNVKEQSPVRNVATVMAPFAPMHFTQLEVVTALVDGGHVTLEEVESTLQGLEAAAMVAEAEAAQTETPAS